MLQGLFNYDNPVWRFIGKLGDLIILNVLWIVCSIPIFTIGASTTAVYYVTLKMVRDEEDSTIDRRAAGPLRGRKYCGGPGDGGHQRRPSHRGGGRGHAEGKAAAHGNGADAQYPGGGGAFRHGRAHGGGHGAGGGFDRSASYPSCFSRKKSPPPIWRRNSRSPAGPLSGMWRRFARRESPS